MSGAAEWFSVDRRGLAMLIEDRGIAGPLHELIQNGLDAPGVTEVHVSLKPIPGLPRAHLEVQDNSTTGFKDLSHAWTLFAGMTPRLDFIQTGVIVAGWRCSHGKTRSAPGSSSSGRNPSGQRAVGSRDVSELEPSGSCRGDGTGCCRSESNSAGTWDAGEKRWRHLRPLRQNAMPLGCAFLVENIVKRKPVSVRNVKRKIRSSEPSTGVSAVPPGYAWFVEKSRRFKARRVVQDAS